MNYIEFRGYKGQRVAIGENSSFMLAEVTETVYVTMPDGIKINNGCLVTIGHYSFYTQDFYPVVIEKLLSIGTPVGELNKMFEKHEHKK